MAADPRRALVFGELAEEYARFRPTYPDDAVAWLSLDARVVAELGSGTGQLTGRLLDRGVAVHAIDADPRMLALLRRDHPSAHAHHATADNIPLPDDSVDAVLSADAWHWFPAESTVAEVRRILRPDGWLGLVWNVPTPRSDWELELAGIDPDKKAAAGTRPTAPVPSMLGAVPAEQWERATFDWAWPITPTGFRQYLATNSAVIRMEPHQREERLEAAEATVRAACEAAGAHHVPLHHEAACFRWRPAN